MPELSQTREGETPLSTSIVFAATFTAEPIEDAMRFWMHELGLDYRLKFAPYNQVFQALLDPASAIRRNMRPGAGGYNILLVRLEDWRSDIDRNARELISAVQIAAAEPGSILILCFCPGPSGKDDPFAEVEQSIADALCPCSNVYSVTSAQIAGSYPVAEYEDRLADVVGHVPYTSEFFAALGTVVMRRIAALSRPAYKVIALDCDNTLWGGVCGEDGPLGVQVTAAHAMLQQFMRDQRAQGMLLCLCSKNNENDVWEVFEQNAGMVLKRDDITAHRINWERKSVNLKALARELNLGLDSFIFLDDSPMECAEVQADCPEVLTLQIPALEDGIPHFLQHVWAFDRLQATGTGRLRSALYEDNRQREQMRQGQDLDSFLLSLQLEIEIAPLAEEHVARVAELTQRSNQFNCMTLRYREDEVRALLGSTTMRCLTVHLRDRFGDYGLIGVLMYSYGETALVVQNFLMSCRALGRRVELKVIEYVAQEARTQDLHWVEIRFAATAKNRPALEFLESLAQSVKLPSKDAGVYRLSASHISLKESGDAAEPASGVLAAEPAPAFRHAPPLARIAKELSTPAAILAAIEAHTPLQAADARGYAAPSDEFEGSIAAIWAKLLRRQRVGRDDDFFQLGGNSLLATQMMSRVGHLHRVRLSLSDIFDHASLQGFAQAVKSAMERGGNFQPVIRGTTRPAQLPLSYGQQRLWFLDQWHPLGHVYNVPMVFRVRGALDIDALGQSLRAIVARHEALRTTFHMQGERAAQQTHAAVEVPLRWVDMRDGGSEAAGMTLLTAEMRRPFNLASDVMLRAIVVQLSDADFLLGLCLQHIAADGWSLDILCREVSAFYAEFTNGRSPAPEPLPIQFADYAVWQRSHLDGTVLDEHLTYWRNQLEGAAPQLRLPTDMPRPATQTFRGALLPFTLPRELATSVADLCRREEVTPFIALLTVLQILLRQYSGQDDISIGSPVANRTMLETESLIGYFANTMVFRTVFMGDPTFRQMLARVRETALGVYQHQHMPFERLVETLKPARAAYNPLFQVNFRVLTEPAARLHLGEAVAERIFFDPGTARFDLALELLATGDRIEGFFEYSTDLFYPETIARMESDFARTLGLLLQQADTPLSLLGLAPLSSPPDRAGPVLRRRSARPIRVLSGSG